MGGKIRKRKNGSVVEAVSFKWVEKVLFDPPPTHRPKLPMPPPPPGDSHIFLKCTRAVNEWQGHFSGTANAYLETAGPSQVGERCWQECHLSKTHPDK